MEMEMGEDDARNPTAQFLMKALKQWSEVYRARKGLFSREMVWLAAKDADPVTCWLQRMQIL